MLLSVCVSFCYPPCIQTGRPGFLSFVLTTPMLAFVSLDLNLSPQFFFRRSAGGSSLRINISWVGVSLFCRLVFSLLSTLFSEIVAVYPSSPQGRSARFIFVFVKPDLTFNQFLQQDTLLSFPVLNVLSPDFIPDFMGPWALF